MRIIAALIACFTFISFSQAQEEYVNPVDGKRYIADWKTYEPKGGTTPQDGRVVNAGVRLLNTQDEFSKNITVKELSKLIGYAQELLNEVSSEYQEGGEILLQITLSKDAAPKFDMSYQGEIQKGMLQAFYDGLSSIELNTSQSSVALQVHFQVKNA
ncbi:MAG: hypothetical protein FHK82_06250 [Sedimenticola thiotaurini]|uniref:Uncharacterized protein n=1 Tax=Sedimenticola thiotaurini TaxID=1543721 RepID=A0A558D8U5_9GAMM|nr:MAG: hypothetical protein FHK82_06250 [Sedimenticola thiotaurini]